MSLVFKHTCPIIDSKLSDIRELVYNNIEDLVNSLVPLFEGNAKYNFVRERSDIIYNIVSERIEELRDLNSDMRDQADTQIKDLEDSVYENEETISDQADKIEELEETIKDLEYRINELEND
jgi:hypothetical protein